MARKTKTSLDPNVQMTDEEQQMLERFKRDIESDADAMDDQRDKANEDMRFVNVDGGMREDWFEDVFDHEDRVRLELDIVSNPLQRFLGERNQNPTGVVFKPDDRGTTTKDSDLLNGIYRSDFRDYSGKIAVDNAIMEIATVGVGSWRLANEFDDDSDPENENQHIEWKPIYNSYNTVYWDQSALRIDKRDAGHCTVLTQYTDASFEKEFPGHQPVSAYTPESRDFGRRGIGATADIPIYYIATRYEIVRKETTAFVYNNLATEKVETYSKEDHDKIKDELADDETRTFVRERTVIHQTCERTVFSGTEILRKTKRVAGKYIPVVTGYGYRAFVDGTERYRGLVRKMKDAQRLYNVQVSQLAENSASAGQEVPIFTREQVENQDISEIWADKNNKPFLMVDNATDEEGNIVAMGPLGYNKPAALDQSTTSLLGIIPAYIQEQTGFVAGEAIDKEASGKALAQLMKRENMNTQVVSENIDTAIAWSGEIYQAMAQEIYTTPRIKRTLERDGTEGEVGLLESVMDQQTGQFVESNDLRTKKFKSYADVGPQYETQREQTVEDMKGIMELLPNVQGGEQYMPIALAVLMDNITGAGLGPLKDFNNRKMIELGLKEPKTDEEIEFAQQLAQAAGAPNPQAELIEAATQQSLAEARNLDAASAEKVANTALKEAQTAKTIAEIGNEQEKVRQTGVKLLQETRQRAREQLRQFPINQNRPQ